MSGLRRTQALAVVVMVNLLISDCVATAPLAEPSPGDSAGLSVREREMRDDTKRFNETVAAGFGTGAFIGFGIGVVVGALSGGNLARSAFTAAAVGCLAGGIDGYITARRERAGGHELRALRATTADVQNDNAYLRDVIGVSNRVVAEGREPLALLQGRVAANQFSARDAEAAHQRERANIDQMQARVMQARQMRDGYRKAGGQYRNPPAGRADLDRELERMDRQIRLLE